MSAADGLLPVGEAVAAGLLAVTAWQIYRNWDELWRDAEQILVGQEPEPQVYTTPTDPEVDTERTTGHAPPEVKTGTPGFDTEFAPKTPNNTANPARELNPFDYIMESRRRNVEGHDSEGGHTGEMHIGKSPEWLRERVMSDPDVKRASSFDTRANANLTQARFVKENKVAIEKWLKSPTKSAFGKKITMDREIGIVVKRNGSVRKTKRAFVYLGKKDSQLGYRIVTSYPIP